MNINEEVPDAEVLVRLEPEELGGTLLRIAAANLQNGTFHPQALVPVYDNALVPQGRRNPYPNRMQPQIEQVLAEAFHWLDLQMLVMPAPGGNGHNGHRVLTRRGRELVDSGAFATYRNAAAFRKELLHRFIADRAWLDLARGEYEGAVFFAFRAVEETVRVACGFPDTDHGVPLMRKAFDKDRGPLADMARPEQEREALAHLFAGAIGSYKNPHSHRTVRISDRKQTANTC